MKSIESIANNYGNDFCRFYQNFYTLLQTYGKYPTDCEVSDLARSEQELLFKSALAVWDAL